jgi:hypothetical protein
MHVGEVPFNAKIEREIYYLIIEAKVHWPREFYVSPQAKDLVEKLLKHEPSERLGAGKPGSNNDFS